jgi:hypothetical protein
VVSDGSSVGVWSLENGSRIIDIQNRGGIPAPTSTSISSTTSTGPVKITSTSWINESSDSLLVVLKSKSQSHSCFKLVLLCWVTIIPQCEFHSISFHSISVHFQVGSDDGSIRIWRDLTDDLCPQDSQHPSNYSLLSYGSGGKDTSFSIGGYEEGGYAYGYGSNVSLASAFIALPDIAASKSGSGTTFYRTVLFCSVLCCSVLYWTVLFCTVLYCVSLRYVKPYWCTYKLKQHAI